MALIDRAPYTGDARPDGDLSKLFVRAALPDALRVILVAKGLTKCGHLAAMGSTTTEFETKIVIVLPEVRAGGDDNADVLSEKVINVAKLAMIWGEAKDQSKEEVTQILRMAEDPNKIPKISGTTHAVSERQFRINHPEKVLIKGHKPHNRFLDRLRRDYLVDSQVKVYQLGEIRLETDQIQSMPGIAKDMAELLKMHQKEDRAQIAGVDDGLRRVDALYQGCERIGIMPFTEDAGPLLYVTKLREHCDKHPGLDHLIEVDRKLRTEFFDQQRYHPEITPDPSSAMLAVLQNQKHLWSDAASAVVQKRMEAKLAGGASSVNPSTPAPAGDGDHAVKTTPPKKVKKKLTKGQQVKARVEKELASMGKGGQGGGRGGQGGGGKGGQGGGKGGQGGGGKGSQGGKTKGKVPRDEWTAIMRRNTPQVMRGGRKVCPFNNSTKGCRFGDQCNDLHECFDCPGQTHKWALRHM